MILSKKFSLLDLSNCEQDVLDVLPDGMQVRGQLNIIDNPSLTRLPRNLGIKLGVWLNGCRNFRYLPEGLSVGTDIGLYDSGITALPDDLTVNGELRISGCVNMTELPSKLTVNGWLILSGCEGITSLPEDLEIAVPYKIYINGSGIDPSTVPEKFRERIGKPGLL